MRCSKKTTPGCVRNFPFPIFFTKTPLCSLLSLVYNVIGRDF